MLQKKCVFMYLFWIKIIQDKFSMLYMYFHGFFTTQISDFEEAKEWVTSSMSLDVNKDVNLFETTIRVLGGLLSAYHLSQEAIFLEKAVHFTFTLFIYLLYIYGITR